MLKLKISDQLRNLGSVACLTLVLSLMIYQINSVAADEMDQKHASRQDKLESFAKCLSEKGYLMYSSFTCASCRAQRKSFGNAFQYINEIECNPAAPNTQVERCLERNIRVIPTWIQEMEGREVKRLEGYQLLEILASASGCDY